MNGEQLSQFLAEQGSRTPLTEFQIKVQQGEGEEKEITSMRVVNEVSGDGTSGGAEKTIVLRVKPPKREAKEKSKSEVEKEKKSADDRRPVQKPATAPVVTV